MTIAAIGRRAAAAARAHRSALAVAMLAAAAACSTDKILSVDRPDLIDPAALNNTAGANALYAGVIGDMSYTMDNTIGVNASTGLMTDELRFGATPPEFRQEDQRAAPESNTLIWALYRFVQQTRGQAERAATVLKNLKATDTRVGEMLGVDALMRILLAEMFCSGVPISKPGEDGSPLTRDELVTSALAKLTEAATAAGSDDRVKNFVAVLRGRALLDQGTFDQAAAAVASVPTAFSYTTFHSTTTDYQKNGFYDYMFNNDGLLVSDHEGINGLNYGTAGDPRVPTTGDGSPSRFDGQTPRYYLTLYNDFSSPSIVASGVEARLIEAESALRAGNTSVWLAKLNAARAPYGLPDLADPANGTARVDLTFRERAFALFATGHRLGDMRRLIRQYARGAETVFPTGAYHKDGLQLGTDVQFIIPSTEKNNPKFTGCIDRAP